MVNRITKNFMSQNHALTRFTKSFILLLEQDVVYEGNNSENEVRGY